MAKYAKQTMKTNVVCPYCGEWAGCWENGSDEQRWRCDCCGEDYYIMYNENSWDDEEEMYMVVDDVTDRHRKSLLEE